jgi:hypothetical protein
MTKIFSDYDAEKDSEINDFADGRIALHRPAILIYVLLKLLDLQKQGMEGVSHWRELLQTGGVSAVEADIDHAIREGRAPADMFFDLAAWEDHVQDSEYGRLLSIDDLPVSAKAFFENLIDLSKYEIDPDLDGQPDYDLYLFLEGIVCFEPTEIITQVARVFEKLVA